MNDINFGSSRNSFAVKWKSNEYLQLDVKRSLFLFSAFCNGDMHLKLGRKSSIIKGTELIN